MGESRVDGPCGELDEGGQGEGHLLEFCFEGWVVGCAAGAY